MLLKFTIKSLGFSITTISPCGPAVVIIYNFPSGPNSIWPTGLAIEYELVTVFVEKSKLYVIMMI